VINGDQPPQGRVDAAEIPEVGVVPLRIDVLRDLAVVGLLGAKGVQARDGAVFKRVDAAAAHRSTQMAASRPKTRV
jgi:hypothetical protein